ncbi:MAG: hydroxymethylglutaryl-CoA lyase [Bacteroidota bacterium]
MIKVIECPRDAMQGIHRQIPTALKIQYINRLLKVGFDTIDFGSFVSPKAIPQMADTQEVLAGLDLQHTESKLLAIVANMRGAEDACKHSEITYLGYPFSISETFQQRNTRRGIQESLELVKQMQRLCETHGKELVIYISMGFGNPYGDPWSADIVHEWAHKLIDLGVGIISLADTVGLASPEVISPVFARLYQDFEQIEFGAHFHSHPSQREEKIQAAWKEGCRRFDVALKGFGGCPFAEDELVGNIATESFFAFCEKEGVALNIDRTAWNEALQLAPQVFG